MAKAGQETSIQECDVNIAIYYRIVKKSRKPKHHTDMMNKSLDRRLQLMNKLSGEGNREDVP